MNRNRLVVNLLLLCFIADAARPIALVAQQQRVKPFQQLIVMDSAGKTVGRATGAISVSNIESSASTDLKMRVVLLLAVDDILIPVLVGHDRFYGGRVLWYESENCMGVPYFPVDTPLLETDAPSMLPQTAIAAPGQTAYITVPGTAHRNITGKSVREFGLQCTNRTVANITAIPTQPLIDLLTVFTPPFTLKAEGNNGNGSGTNK